LKKVTVLIIILLSFFSYASSNLFFGSTLERFYSVEHNTDNDVEIVKIRFYSSIVSVFTNHIYEINILNDSVMNELSIKHEIPYEYLKNSYGVTLKREVVGPYNSICDNKKHESQFLDNSITDIIDNRLRITTMAFIRGFTVSGARIYEVISLVEWVNQFTLLRPMNDRLVIWHDSNAIIHSNYHHLVNSFLRGLQIYTSRDGWEISSFVTIQGTWNYVGGHGMDHLLRTLDRRGNWSSSRNVETRGNIFLIVPRYAAVQTVYVHNERMGDWDITVTIGPFGVTIPWNHNGTLFRARPLTLGL